MPSGVKSHEMVYVLSRDILYRVSLFAVEFADEGVVLEDQDAVFDLLHLDGLVCECSGQLPVASVEPQSAQWRR
jgi:hypothetical protein